MIFRRFRIAGFPALLGLALAVAGPATAQQRPAKRGQPIQFSEPQSDVVRSNVNELDTKKTSLKSLEQELKKPFELFSPLDDSSTRFHAPAPQRRTPSAAQSKRMKELLEKRDDWIFLVPEDYNALELTAEDIFNLPEYGPNGEEKKRKTPLERYFERMEKKRNELQGAVTNQARDEATSDPLLDDKEKEDLKSLSFGGKETPLSSGLSDLEITAKNLAPAETSAFTSQDSESRKKGLTELFGLGNSDSDESKSDKSRAETRIQEFKQLMETRSLGTPNLGPSSYNPVAGFSAATPPAGFSGLDAFSSGGGTLGGLNSFVPLASPPALLPSLTPPASSLGSPSWQTPLPAPQSPRVSLPPPTFNIPQRKF